MESTWEKGHRVDDFWSLEKKLFKFTIIASVVSHLLVIVVNWKVSFDWSSSLEEEWVIDAALVSDSDGVMADQDTNIPDAENAPEPAVPNKLLPQLTKTFSVKKQDLPETGEQSIQGEEVAEQAPEKPKEQGKVAEVEEKQQSDDNALSEEEALKRMKIEQLRRLAKKEEIQKIRAKVKKLDPVAKLRSQAESAKGLGSSGKLASLKGTYQQKAYKAIRRHYTIPDIETVKKIDRPSRVRFYVDARGMLMDYRIEESSGNEAFDKHAVQTLLKAEPLPTPPKPLVGEAIVINFSP